MALYDIPEDSSLESISPSMLFADATSSVPCPTSDNFRGTVSTAPVTFDDMHDVLNDAWCSIRERSYTGSSVSSTSSWSPNQTTMPWEEEQGYWTFVSALKSPVSQRSNTEEQRNVAEKIIEQILKEDLDDFGMADTSPG